MPEVFIKSASKRSSKRSSKRASKRTSKRSSPKQLEALRWLTKRRNRLNDYASNELIYNYNVAFNKNTQASQNVMSDKENVIKLIKKQIGGSDSNKNY